MHCLAVVTEGFLSEPLGIPALFGTFGPSVAIGMERDACDAQTKAPLLELRRAVARPDAMEIGEQQTFLG